MFHPGMHLFANDAFHDGAAWWYRHTDAQFQQEDDDESENGNPQSELLTPRVESSLRAMGSEEWGPFVDLFIDTDTGVASLAVLAVLAGSVICVHRDHDDVHG